MDLYFRKAFLELLEINGVKIPPNHRKEATWLQKRRVSAFRKKWEEVAHLYSNLEKLYESEDYNWEASQEYLENEWGLDMPPILPHKEIRFKSPKKAKKLISKEIERLEEAEGEGYRLGNIARANWVKELIKKAPEGCRLIVIKNTNYTPEQESIERFEESVTKRETCAICISLLIPVWIALYPEDLEDMGNSLRWAIKRNTSSVEYLF